MTTLFKKILGLSLSAKVLLGFALGIFSGIFFGEAMAFLKIVGDGFIHLLQMTVLPYVILSLITGLGRLNYSEAVSLAKKGGLFLLLLWALVIATVLVIPLAYPVWKTASFFSTALIEKAQDFNLLELYIPANPFYSMSANIVPAVVLFSVALGVALISIKNKNIFIENCSIIANALGRVTGFVINLAPIGIFAIAASATGTMETGEFGRLQVYFVTYLAAWAVMAFWTLPALVTSFTPIRYKDMLGESKGVLIAAFAIGNLFVVLPFLAEVSKKLLSKYDLGGEESDSVVDVIVQLLRTLHRGYTIPAGLTAYSARCIPALHGQRRCHRPVRDIAGRDARPGFDPAQHLRYEGDAYHSLKGAGSICSGDRHTYIEHHHGSSILFWPV
jgi:Na+/H+-dicarboxylate symporter